LERTEWPIFSIDIALAEAFVETYQLKDSTLNKDSALQKEIESCIEVPWH